MLNNDSQCPDLGVRQNTRCHGIRWGLVSGSWCLQTFVGKTDKFERPLLGRLWFFDRNQKASVYLITKASAGASDGFLISSIKETPIGIPIVAFLGGIGAINHFS
jgi:hypothetical protein